MIPNRESIIVVTACIALLPAVFGPTVLKCGASTMESGQHMASAQVKEQPHSKGKSNRLINEKSPYLLQHAYNPVDWYPWGEEAFEKARREDKPIFLSIGYSTCHWCHVMERESFEDSEVARLMNDAWVSIKVDREERPDLDHVYMTVCRMLTQSGGWPLNVLMTPDKKPFFAGTYFPKQSMHGRIGMLDLTAKIKELWATRRNELVESSEKIVAALKQVSNDAPGKGPGPEALKNAHDRLWSSFDPKRGGFGNAPKFPTPHNLMFLLRYWKRTGDEKALEMVEKTLQAMRRGGIYDHVGYGFHRYSTDTKWLLPHFEKMLYDQAMLAMAYTEAYQATGRWEYGDTVREILTYVLRDMTDPGGGFYSAEDADSEGVEGKFYFWKPDQIRSVLPADEADLVIRTFNAFPEGNFTDEATGEAGGTNILHLKAPLAASAKELGIPESELKEKLESARQKLFMVREERIHPYKDDKILTDWNGLMIAALAKAAQALDEPKYAQAASKAADFILNKMRDSKGRLLHRYRLGEAGLPSHVDDYAFFIWGLLELYEATFDVDRLKTALELNKDFIARFWDDKAGGFYFTADDHKDVLVRNKEIYDGATPSGNSVAAMNMIRLGRMTANPDLENMAHKVGQTFSGNVTAMPSAHTQLLMAVEFSAGPSHEVVIVGEPGAADSTAMLNILRSGFLPNKVVLFRPMGADAPAISGIADFTKFQKALNGKATAYVCRNYSCEMPTTDPKNMLELLSIAKP